MMDLLVRRNDALDVNPPTGVDMSLSVNGSDWLWAVTAVHIVFFVSNLLHSLAPLGWLFLFPHADDRRLWIVSLSI